MAAVAFGLMWNLEEVVPLLPSPYNTMEASVKVAQNISWWFAFLGVGYIFFEIAFGDDAQHKLG